MNSLASLALVLLLTSQVLAETIAIDATPSVRVTSGPGETKRHVLSKSDQEKNQLVIVKRAGGGRGSPRRLT
jgi:hypothetical protein